uniref:CDP-diacylglycerol--glycerol-3-phosphate 3-phosphatidyltransferase n=1 Tax=Romanomermis culicivorax TaxID=13658 RepID=A0A915I1A3_ROMCU
MSSLDRELDEIFADLPEFQLNGDSIEILKSPGEFYENLLKLIRNAKRRIILCSLYLGDDELTLKLIDEISSVLEQKPDLQLKMLIDFNRSTRKNDNCLKNLKNLMRNFGSDRVQIAFFHTPLLRNWRKNFFPSRWNEIFGVQHMKLYIFDDDLLISGANLSESYFTNRQDRYFLLKFCPLLTEFYQQIVDVFSQFSFKLGQSNDGNLEILENSAVHPFEGDFRFFTSRLKKKVGQILENHKNSILIVEQDTKISPIIQMGVCGLEDENLILEKLFELKSKVNWRIASGYFNLTQKYQDLLLQNFDQNRISILTASPG